MKYLVFVVIGMLFIVVKFVNIKKGKFFMFYIFMLVIILVFYLC